MIASNHRASSAEALLPTRTFFPAAVQTRRPHLAGTWGLIAAVSALGLLGLHPTFSFFAKVWISDPLRSIGVLLLPISIVLTLRTWKQLHWELRGTWWGLLPVALAFIGSLLLYKNMGLFLIFGPHQSTLSLFPTALPPYLYGSGIVLLFGGASLWRKAWFPLLLLLLLNPVPTIFATLVDLPMQHAAAHIARLFATAIGFAPTTPQLQLMFSPSFGMFIAPGCDGIRGAAAMGYMALILGHIKRFTLPRWGLYTLGAVLLGYAFNFLRLCTLVLYYRIALGHPALENIAKQADYTIGACLCLIATLLFVHFIMRNPSSPVIPQPAKPSQIPQQSIWKVLAVALLLAAPLVMSARTILNRGKDKIAPGLLAERMPLRIGDYVRTRTWYEQISGVPVMEDAAYSKPGAPGEITLGAWISSSMHNSNLCMLLSDATPQLLTTGLFPTAKGRLIGFDTGFFIDGITDTLLWNTLCTSQSCSQFHSVSTHANIYLQFTKPVFGNETAEKEHMVPILLKVEQVHTSVPVDETGKTLSAKLQDFSSDLDILQLSQQFQ